MDSFDLLITGRFNDAIKAFHSELSLQPDDIASMDGLSKSYQGVGDFEAAIPLMERVHEYQRRNPDHPGQLLHLAVAYWCLEDRVRAMELARGLCAAILDGSVSMAPDHAGGATYGLVLHYMAVTARNESNLNFALNFLQRLNRDYNKQLSNFRYPVQTVKQLLGELNFEEALAGATGEHELSAAYRAASTNRSVKLQLGTALFHDGVIRRVGGDEAGCTSRMREVCSLGYQTDAVRWYLARHEVENENHPS